MDGCPGIPTSGIRAGFLDFRFEILRFHRLKKMKNHLFYLIGYTNRSSLGILDSRFEILRFHRLIKMKNHFFLFDLSIDLLSES